MPYIDSHCHLNYPDFINDQADVIERAHANNVSHMLTICTRLSEANDIIDLCEKYPTIFASIGIHPHEAEKHQLNTLKEDLTPFFKHQKVIGIGETGLDYFYENSPRLAQIKNFEIHLDLALQQDLPIIVHSRDADDDTISILRNFPQVKGVIHCFSGTQQLASQALSLGFFISVAGIITFKKAEELRKIIHTIPLEKLLIETDSPFLAPIPYRGKRNEPKNVIEVAKQLANIKQCSIENIAHITSDNFFCLFKKAATGQTKI